MAQMTPAPNRCGRISRSRACVREQSQPRHADRKARFVEPDGRLCLSSGELLSRGSHIAVLGKAPGSRIARSEQPSARDRSQVRASTRLCHALSTDARSHIIIWVIGDWPQGLNPFPLHSPRHLFTNIVNNPVEEPSVSTLTRRRGT